MTPIRPKRLLRSVGRRIAELRGDRGLTQERCAEILRVSSRYLRRVEAGEENLSLTSLARIANCLRVPIVRLFEASPTPSRPAD